MNSQSILATQVEIFHHVEAKNMAGTGGKPDMFLRS